VLVFRFGPHTVPCSLIGRHFFHSLSKDWLESNPVLML
jgi:hypothetical protein